MLPPKRCDGDRLNIKSIQARDRNETTKWPSSRNR